MKVRPSSEGTERSELEVGLQSGDKKGFSVELLPILPIIFNLWVSHRMLKETPLVQPGVASCQDGTQGCLKETFSVAKVICLRIFMERVTHPEGNFINASRNFLSLKIRPFLPEDNKETHLADGNIRKREQLRAFLMVNFILYNLATQLYLFAYS